MDWTSLFSGGGGFGAGGAAPPPKSSATATSVIEGHRQTEQLQTLLPWIIGGMAVVVVAFAVVAIALIRR